MSWYVVFKGRKAGVYATWELCHLQVTGYKNNCYKSYKSQQEALQAYCDFLMGDEKIKEEKVEKGKKYDTLEKCCNFCTICTHFRASNELWVLITYFCTMCTYMFT